MKEEDLEDLNTLYGKQELYILTRKVLAEYQRRSEESFLLRNGELVKGLYYTWCKKTVVHWIRMDGDVYLGIGVLHKWSLITFAGKEIYKEEDERRRVSYIKRWGRNVCVEVIGCSYQ